MPVQPRLEDETRIGIPRALRVNLPVLVSFATSAFTVREFAINLSESGIFVPTERLVPLGTRGKLTFRTSQFDEPFTLEAEVVRVVTLEQHAEGAGPGVGVGMQFLDLGERELALLRKLVSGMHSGSISQAIRRSIQDSHRTIDQELRRRPTDQKMILAAQATNEEIVALLRDGNPSVLSRLLDCPRLTTAHLLTMLRNPKLPTRVLSAINRSRKWISNPEVRRLFVVHTNTMLSEAISQLRMVSAEHVRVISRDMKVKPQIRSKAAEMVNKRGPKIRIGRR